jgi:hypothetical protein
MSCTNPLTSSYLINAGVFVWVPGLIEPGGSEAGTADPDLATSHFRVTKSSRPPFQDVGDVRAPATTEWKPDLLSRPTDKGDSRSRAD